ncbi:MAG: HAD family hydrolase, partial [Gemmatimonadaceae bacterium]
HKPDPEPVRIALDRLNTPANQALFVGDSVHDMYAGNAAGVTTVAALWGPFTREDLAPSTPRYHLDRVRDLPALVSRLAAGTAETGP